MKEMDKSAAKKRANRSLSVTFFIASIILIICSLTIIVSCITTNVERQRLLKIEQILKEQNEEFQIINEHLRDDHYYEIYVREEYQFNGKNIIRLPRK